MLRMQFAWLWRLGLIPTCRRILAIVDCRNRTCLYPVGGLILASLYFAQGYCVNHPPSLSSLKRVHPRRATSKQTAICRLTRLGALPLWLLVTTSVASPISNTLLILSLCVRCLHGVTIKQYFINVKWKNKTMLYFGSGLVWNNYSEYQRLVINMLYFDDLSC